VTPSGTLLNLRGHASGVIQGAIRAESDILMIGVDSQCDMEVAWALLSEWIRVELSARIDKFASGRVRKICLSWKA
jgi:hypothetical protein